MASNDNQNLLMSNSSSFKKNNAETKNNDMTNGRIDKNEILECFSVLANAENKQALGADMYGILLQQDPSNIEKFLEGLEACRTAALEAMRAVAAEDSKRAMMCTAKNATNDDSETILIVEGSSKHSESSSLPSVPSIPVEAIHQICQSDFLTINEVGRLLFLVSKSIYQSFGRERAWELVCCKQWRNTIQISKHVIERRGYEWLFRQRYKRPAAEGEESHKPDKLADAELSPDKLILLISIYNSRKKEVVSLTLRDGALKKLLDTGELNVALPEPVPLGSFAVSDEGVIDFDMFCTEFIHWTATLHLLRLDKQQFSRIHESSECSWGEYDYCEDPNYQTEEPTTVKPLAIDWSNIATVPTPKTGSPAKPPPVEVDMGYLEFSSAGGLDFSVVGKAFEDRIRALENFSDGDVLQDIRIEPTLLCFTKDFQPSLKSVGLHFSELRLDVWKRYRSGAAMIFHSAKEAKRHNVTLLHLLDQLNDWDG